MNEQSQKIHIIMTGGTIDSHWDPKGDTAVPNEHSVIPHYLDSLKLYEDFEFTEACMKDSRSMTPEDLKKVLQIIVQSPSRSFVVTHGTYTMPDTARFLQANLNNNNKVIVLTGSMIPLKGFDLTDAPFNLGYAIGEVKILEPGVYLAMNGKSFTAEEVSKNIPEGRFYSIFQKQQ
jgi:L-asparaginase